MKNTLLEQALGEVEDLTLEQERNRLAREIHDGIGQRLHASIMLAGGLLERESDPLRQRPLSLLLGALTGLEHEVRRAVKALAATDEVGLEEGLARLLDYYRYGGPDSRLDLLGQPRQLSPLVRHTLYRIAQEGLTNAIKHARARQIVLTLDYRDPQTVRLMIADDGVGLPVGEPQPDSEGGFGLRNMRERAALVGGHLSIDSSTQGVRIWVSIPHPSES
ncbi:MAG TPA: ATP-binding protein [Roseiflexaceae bacterium]|nr:ATP-binding protein [Roseiflexaceae bacterium]